MSALDCKLHLKVASCLLPFYSSGVCLGGKATQRAFLGLSSTAPEGNCVIFRAFFQFSFKREHCMTTDFLQSLGA